MAAPLIISASYRTDIPAFYGAWFRQRLAAGYALVKNPYGGKDYRVSLHPDDVAAFVFWTRNAQPFFPVLDDIADTRTPFFLQVTITGYPTVLESSTITIDKAIDQVTALRARYGRDAVVWRYDPILFTSLTDRDWHLAMFEYLCRGLKGAVTECVTSFATHYAKTKRRLGQLDGIEAWDPPADEKKALLLDLSSIAGKNHMALTLCSQPDLLVPGVAPAKCIDADRLSRLADRPIFAREKGNRPGCLCAQSRDIGAYDTCPHGCVYCYAVRDAQKAKDALAQHAPDAETL